MLKIMNKINVQNMTFSINDSVTRKYKIQRLELYLKFFLLTIKIMTREAYGCELSFKRSNHKRERDRHIITSHSGGTFKYRIEIRTPAA